MDISNSQEKFTPDTAWMRKKYIELNDWLFGGQLGPCLFEIYTTGRGSQGNSLGHFRLTGDKLIIRRSDRRIISKSLYPETQITKDNFYEIVKPVIGFNGHYKRTELAWLTTLTHEMCHYYTYMRGYAPVQAHGPEFRSIASYVSHKSNGIFEIKRLSNCETDSELDAEMVAKAKRKEENKKNNIVALLIFKQNGEIQLVTTTSKNLIDQIIRLNLPINNGRCEKILKSNDSNLIEYLWSKGYKNNMRAYRYWRITKQEVVDEFNKYPNEKIIMNMNKTNESINITANDIREMVEMAINKIQNKNEFIEISPNDIFSDGSLDNM